MPRARKQTNFEGVLYDQKDRVGGYELVIDTGIMQLILADAGVQAATTVHGLVTALQAAVATIKASLPPND